MVVPFYLIVLLAGVSKPFSYKALFLSECLCFICKCVMAMFLNHTGSIAPCLTFENDI